MNFFPPETWVVTVYLAAILPEQMMGTHGTYAQRHLPSFAIFGCHSLGLIR